MSNFTDFYQTEQTKLAVPAENPIVYLDGQPCPHLQVIEIIRAGGPQYGSAKLAYNPAMCPDADILPNECIERIIGIGRRVSVHQFYNEGLGWSHPQPIVIFDGHIEKVFRHIDGKRDTVEFTAADFSAPLGRITIHGRRVVDLACKELFLPAEKTIFNEDGRPNCSKSAARNNCRSYCVFSSGQEEAKLWTYADAVYYLLCEHLGCGGLHIPDLGVLEGLFDSKVCGELNVEGLCLLEALEKCCAEISVGFRFAPAVVNEQTGQSIVFYKKGTGRIVELNCQYPRQQVNLSRTNLAAVDVRTNYWPLTHRYHGFGDYKIFEATFPLIKAWDPAGEGAGRLDYSVDADGFEAIRDVYRKWCLNEAGDYSCQPYNQGPVFDFSAIFGTDRYLVRRRRFYKTLSTDSENKSLDYYLEISYDNGQVWQKYNGKFDILSSECGVWLGADELDPDFWNSATTGTLRLRITASMVSDEKLSVSIAKGPVDSVVPVVEHAEDLAGKFAYRKVSCKSIFCKPGSPIAAGADEIDQTDKLVDYMRRMAEAENNVIATIDIQTPVLETGFEAGDIVSCSPGSRDIIGLRDDGRSRFWIESVRMDFPGQCTYLRILRSRDSFLNV